MVCSTCGKELPEGATVCTGCGVPVPGANVAAAPVTYAQPQSSAPAAQFNPNYSLVKYILLGIITFGIYPIVVMSSISERINVIAGRYDGKKTMHYCLLFFLVSWITLGIGSLVWFHRISDRIGNELRRRGISSSFGAGTFWIFDILLSIVVVGPFIYFYQLFQAMNQLCTDYNQRG